MRQTFGVVFLVVSAAWNMLSAQVGSVGGTVVAQRQSDDRNTVLISVPPSVDGTLVDTVRIAVGRGVARGAVAQTLPEGWTMAVERGWLLFTGRATETGDALAISAAVDRALDPGNVDVELRAGGSTLAKRVVPLQTWAALGPPRAPGDVVTFPSIVSAESPTTFGLLDPDFRLPPGRWLVGGRTAAMVAPATFEVTLGQPILPEGDIPMSYADLWGHTLVDGALTGVRFVPDADLGEPPRITGCSPKVLSGGVLCVCGYFPTKASREGLAVGGLLLDKPLTSSKWVLTFRLPEIPPGEFTVEGPGDAGYEAGNVARGRHIAVRGEIDRETLMRGQSTPLTLWIDGTDEEISMRLWNTTPGIASLDGDEDQVVTTGGGSPNRVQKKVNAVSPGDFLINFELSGHWCPCAETVAEQAVTELAGTTGVAEVDDRIVSEACARAAVDCGRFRLLAQAASRAASEARTEAQRLEANQRWVDDETEWVLETSDRTRVHLAALQRQVQGWRELADKARALAERNRQRDAEFPVNGWDHWARQAEQDAARRNAHADELEREIESVRGDTVRQEDRVYELQEAIDTARALAARAQVEADKAWAAYQACLSASTTECSSPVSGSLLYAGPVTVFDDDGEPIDIFPLSPEKAPPEDDEGDPKENAFCFEGISPICAQPRRYPCGPTVEFLGECVHAQVLNYIQWGLMNELCGQPLQGDFWHRARAYGTFATADYDAQVTISGLGATYARARRRHDADPNIRDNPATWPPDKLRDLRRELLRQVLTEETRDDEDWDSRQAALCAPICRLTPVLERSLAMQSWTYIWLGISKESPARLVVPQHKQEMPKMKKR